MSKTDKTRPWWVRATERPLHTCVPVHRHENGLCDLPAYPADGFGFRGPERCYWTEGNGFYYGPGAGCGCAVCTGRTFRRAERRANRHAAARVCRDAARVYRGVGAEEFEGFDDYAEPAKRWW